MDPLLCNGIAHIDRQAYTAFAALGARHVWLPARAPEEGSIARRPSSSPPAPNPRCGTRRQSRNAIRQVLVAFVIVLTYRLFRAEAYRPVKTYRRLLVHSTLAIILADRLPAQGLRDCDTDEMARAKRALPAERPVASAASNVRDV
ncbi:MAG: hypothetical protein OXQ84_20480 [bacterium]|nr:hypothetical protein [bacterium]